MARPTKFTQELADKICETIATTSKSLRVICNANDISTSTLLKWLSENEDFSIQYARAKQMQAELFVDEIIEIADETSNDTIYQSIGGGENDEDSFTVERENKEWIKRSQIRIDARKWIASKLLPKKYGNNIDVTSGGDKVESTTIVTQYVIPALGEIELKE